MSKLFYLVSLSINKELYDHKKIDYDTYKFAEKSISSKLKEFK